LNVSQTRSVVRYWPCPRATRAFARIRPAFSSIEISTIHAVLDR
jgi:hypothetical protein